MDTARERGQRTEKTELLTTYEKFAGQLGSLPPDQKLSLNATRFRLVCNMVEYAI
jgi:hypothetical protein